MSLVQRPLLIDEASLEYFSHLFVPWKDIPGPLCFKPLSLYFYKLIMTQTLVSLERLPTS